MTYKNYGPVKFLKPAELVDYFESVKTERNKKFDEVKLARKAGDRSRCENLLDDVEKLSNRLEEVNDEILKRTKESDMRYEDRDNGETPQTDRSEFYDTRTGEKLRTYRAGVTPSSDGLTFGDVAKATLTGKGLDDVRAQGISTGASGGFTIPDTIYSRLIEAVTNRSTVMQTGAPMVEMPHGNLTIATIDAVTAGAWTGENTAIDDATVAFGAISMTARKCALLLRVSNELFHDSPNAIAALNQAVVDSISQAVDQGCLSGTGVGSQPLGLLNWQDSESTPLKTTDLEAANLTWENMLSSYYALVGNNAGPRISAFMNPLIAGILDAEREGVTGAYVMGRPAARDNIDLTASAQLGVTADKSKVLLGDFSRGLIIGVSNTMEAQWNEGLGFDKDQLTLRVTLRMDVAVTRPSFFEIFSNVATV